MVLQLSEAFNIEPELENHDYVPRPEENRPNNKPIAVQRENKMVINFTAFPPEIRNIIYRLLLQRDEVIPICSPLKKKKSKFHRYYYELFPKEDSAIGILSVNKQIREEACSIFYSHNEFCVGNNDWGVTLKQNIHGLKALTSRVPAHFIAQIKQVELRISTHYRSSGYQPIYPVLLGSKLDVTEVQQIIRILKKHFTGMEAVYFGWDHEMVGTGQPKMPRDETVVEFTNLVKSVMEIQHVKCIMLSNNSDFNDMSHEITGLRDVVARIKEETLQSHKDLTVEEFPGEPQIDLQW